MMKGNAAVKHPGHTSHSAAPIAKGALSRGSREFRISRSAGLAGGSTAEYMADRVKGVLILAAPCGTIGGVLLQQGFRRTG